MCCFISLRLTERWGGNLVTQGQWGNGWVLLSTTANQAPYFIRWTTILVCPERWGFSGYGTVSAKTGPCWSPYALTWYSRPSVSWTPFSKVRLVLFVDGGHLSGADPECTETGIFGWGRGSVGWWKSKKGVWCSTGVLQVWFLNPQHQRHLESS